jgi:hypothetical protein
MPSLQKKVPPPPKEPGTHTNAEVKEALHARALRRTILVTAVVFLLLACLAVVSNAAREAVNAAQPKMVMIVTKGLSPDIVSHAMNSNKAPFTRILSNLGGSYDSINAATAASSNRMVNLLTGSASETKTTLSGLKSVLRWLKEEKKTVVVAAPSSYWSSGTAGATTCAQVGLLDTECSGTACPSENAAAYCNAKYKFVTCNDRAQLYKDELPTAFEKAINLSADVLYFQVDGIAEAAANDLEGLSRERSEVNLLDSAVGRVAMALSLRSADAAENWLMIVTSDGANSKNKAPLLVVAYSNGKMLQLNSIPSGATTSDVVNTVKMWFEAKDADSKRLLGICSSGATVKNCKTAV